MSQETLNWLNTRTLIGFTEKRGNAWHYRENEQGTESNHYPHAIPVEDVQRRLFNFEVVKRPVYVASNLGPIVIPGRKAIATSDTNEVLGIFKDGYEPHQPTPWLLDTVATILDDDLSISSALLLRNRGVAVVEVSVPENFETKDGVVFRPNLLAATSFDGTLATIFKRTLTNTVCDNTFEMSLQEDGQQYKLKHTRYSSLRLGEARDALNIIFESADAYSAEIDRLCATEVSDAAWTALLDQLAAVPTEDGRKKNNAIKVRSTLETLYTSDERVEPWAGSAWGVVQAFNTYDQHYGQVKGAHRAERNFDNVLTGKSAAADQNVLLTLGQIIDKDLVLA